MNAKNWKHNFVSFLTKRSIFVTCAVLTLTVFLLLPLFQMGTNIQASPNPPHEVYELQKEIDRKFPTSVHFASFVMEAKNGDVLTRDVLLEFKQNKTQLLELDLNGKLASGSLEKQPYLFAFFDPITGIEVKGISSILEPIEAILFTSGKSLESCSDEELKFAVHKLLSNTNSSGAIDFLSRHASFEKREVLGQEIQWWTSPAMIFTAVADNSKLGGAGLEIGIGGGPDVINKEHLNRRIDTIMAGESKAYEIWGVAIDANLESEEEGKEAGIFVTFTIIAALIVVGISLKSYWATSLTGIGLGILIIWVKGFSALIGIKSGLVIDLIVPISMISLGVDFAVHSIRRYKEEKDVGNTPRNAFAIGMTGVLVALLLAMASDSIAFLSNLSSNIEAVIHFGGAAAIATISSFILLGIVAPLSLMRIDELMQSKGNIFSGLKYKIFGIAGGIGISFAAGGSVILLIAVSKTIGVVMLGLTTFVFIIVPLTYIFFRVKNIRKPENQSSEKKSYTKNQFQKSYLQILVKLATSYPKLVILITTLITSISIFFAFNLEPTFDVKDFYDPDSDMVIGLDKIDDHIGEQGGEPGIAFIEGDLMDPNAIASISQFIESLREVNQIATRPSGEITLGYNIVNISKMIIENPKTIQAIKSSTGILIEDKDQNLIPDTKLQMLTAIKFTLENGIISDNGITIVKSDEVREAIYFSNSEADLTRVIFQIPGTRNQMVVNETAKAVNPLLQSLEAQPSISKARLTGSPFTREVQLSASTRTLYTSLPIAIIAATLLLIITMRSFKYAIVTVIPIGLVVAWLYGIMNLAGFSLNFVTAMIGAISIGIGIDYSIHMTERFREEFKRNLTRSLAIQKAARGTGTALLGSAASSIVGFAIMGFAPMPMFASYGQLTALMIFLAFISSIVVLPCLLMLITKEKPNPESLEE